MLTLSLATLRHQARRYLAPGLAVVIGVAFITATLTLTSSLTGSLRDTVAGQYASYTAVVTSAKDDGSVPDEVADLVAGVDGVSSIDPIRTGTAVVHGATGEQYAMVTSEAAAAPHPIIEGRPPRGPTEVALSRSAASQSDLSVGDTAPFVALGGDASDPTRATVVGLIDVSQDPRFAGGTPAVFATPEGVTLLTGTTGWQEIGVVAPGDEAEVASEVAQVLPESEEVVVWTASERADERVEALTAGSDLLGTFFLAFAVIALFVAAIVIANTFAILLARRARETAMLRAIGSTRRQVVVSALLEAGVIGVVFSVAGVLAGLALARGLIGAGNTFGGDALPDLGLHVPVSAVVAPVGVGVAVVLVAALRPVLRSSRVAPLEALRPDAAVTARSRRGARRVGAGVLLGALGGGALAVAASGHSVPAGLIGGLLSFAGVLLAGSVLIPLLARGIGIVAARPFGVAGQLAVDNAVRNPARAAATASALLVGVTLVAMTAVGAATTKAAVTAAVDAQQPVDLVVQATDVPPATVQRLEQVDGVRATSGARGTQVRLTGGATGEAHVLARPTDIDQVTRDAAAFPTVTPGQVILAPAAAQEAGLAEGDPVVLAGPDGRARLTVVVRDGSAASWLVTPADLTALDTDAPTVAAYLRLADDADVEATLDAVRQNSSDLDSSSVSGGAPTREATLQALDMALAVVLALLAISVVIAVVGIANTLSLSVIERTRESALLRALGLTKGQLRLMLAVEAGLLAAVGVVLGILLGTVYALVGVTAMLGEVSVITPVLPWTQLTAISAVAVLAGLLASVLPARRAARVTPAAALAVE